MSRNHTQASGVSTVGTSTTGSPVRSLSRTPVTSRGAAPPVRPTPVRPSVAQTAPASSITAAPRRQASLSTIPEEREPFNYQGVEYLVVKRLAQNNYAAINPVNQQQVIILFFTPDEVDYNRTVAQFDTFDTIKSDNCFKTTEISGLLLVPVAWGTVSQGTTDLSMFAEDYQELQAYPKSALIILPYVHVTSVSENLDTINLPLFLYQTLSLLETLQRCGYGLGSVDISKTAFNQLTANYMLMNPENVTQFDQAQTPYNLDKLNKLYAELTGEPLFTVAGTGFAVSKTRAPSSLSWQALDAAAVVGVTTSSTAVNSYTVAKAAIANKYFLNVKQPLLQRFGNTLVFNYPDQNKVVTYDLNRHTFSVPLGKAFEAKFKLSDNILLPEVDELSSSFKQVFGLRPAPTTSVKNLYTLQQLYLAYTQSNNSSIRLQACSGLELYKFPACSQLGYNKLSPPAFNLSSIPWLVSYPEALIVYYWQIATLAGLR